jgi:hypothetical protein
LKINWVLENIKKNKNSNDFYVNSRLNILLLLASVHLWKKNHRDDTTVLYGDDLTIDTLERLKVLDYFDIIKPIPKTGRKIDKDVFWAASKLEVLSQIDEPIIIMDNDTHVYKPLKHHLDLSKVYVCNFEKGKGYYPTAIDTRVQKLSYKTRWKTESVNVGFLNLPDPEFTRRYANESLKMMEEFTAMGVPHSQYLIFAEQLLLKHMLLNENIEHKSIIATTWDCKEWQWGEDHENGVWPIYESEIYFKHYGPLKGWIKASKADQDYDTEIAHLLNCINNPNLDLSSVPNR